MPAASIQLWFCGYSSTYQAFGQYRYMRSASVPSLAAMAARSAAGRTG